MANKVTFTARKDPLLRPRQAAAASRADEPRPDDRAPASRLDAATVAGARAIEGPSGVVAVDPVAPGPPRGPGDAATPPPAERTSLPAAPARRPARRAEGRVQTSISLPPDVWDTLDAQAQQASDTTGKLLIAILAAAIPDTPAAAFAVVEQLLLGSGPDDALHEERNYRLPVDLRTRLDELAAALGAGPHRQRSLLIRAILSAHAPSDTAQARELLTQRRLAQLRPGETAAA